MIRRKDVRTYYIGLSTTYHDPALALLDPAGEILYAQAGERHRQAKRALNAEPDDLFVLPRLLRRHAPDAEAFVIAHNWRRRRPLYERLARWLGWVTPEGILHREGKRLNAWLDMYEFHHMQASQHFALRRAALNLARVLRRDFPGCAVRFRHYDHHLTHAALGCFGSPYRDALCAVIDSYGEQGSMAFYRYRDGELRLLSAMRGPQSLGFYYMKLTDWCGFEWLGGEEWKVMGLASYGQTDPVLLEALRAMMAVDDLRLITRHEVYRDRLQWLEGQRRQRDAPAEAAADLAHTGQRFFVETVNRLLTNLHGRHLSDNLVLCGGCALNSVANGQVLRATPFRSLYVPPAPADDGTALGAAWLAYRADHPTWRPTATPLSPYLGERVGCSAIERFARHSGLPHRYLPDEGIVPAAAGLLAAGKIIGWIQGSAEFGPRALGNRSILADPRPPDMGDRVNRDIKFRERFRPYAPAILAAHGPEFFEDYQESPYMERTLVFRPGQRQRVPAVVHVDGTGRLQTVKREWNPRFCDLLEDFHRRSGVPVLLNTSFNVMGKPIVHSVEDAFGVFLGSGMDALVIGDHLFEKPGSRP